MHPGRPCSQLIMVLEVVLAICLPRSLEAMVLVGVSVVNYSEVLVTHSWLICFKHSVYYLDEFPTSM